MARERGLVINGYRFSKNYSERKLIYAKAAKVLLQKPGLTRAEFIKLVYDDTRFKNYRLGEYDHFCISRGRVSNYLWNKVKEKNKIHYYPNEWTQQVADMEGKWLEEKEKEEQKAIKAQIKRFTPVHTTLNVGDVVKYAKSLTNYASYSPHYGFTRIQDFIEINCRNYIEYEAGHSWSYTGARRLPVIMNPLNIKTWNKKTQLDKGEVNWSIYGSNDSKFTDSIVLEVMNIPVDQTNINAIRKRVYYEWSFIKILPLNGEEPFWTYAYGWEVQKNKKSRARAIQAQV